MINKPFKPPTTLSSSISKPFKSPMISNNVNSNDNNNSTLGKRPNCSMQSSSSSLSAISSLSGSVSDGFERLLQLEFQFPIQYEGIS